MYYVVSNVPAIRPMTDYL